MTVPHPLRLRLLRMLLLMCGLTWAASLFGVFANWDAAEQTLLGLGAKRIACDRMLDYWLRMAAGAFGMVGIGYLLLALNPARYQALLPWAGWFMIIEGSVLVWHGFRIDLPPFPFYADISACFFGGGAVLVLRYAARAGIK